MNIKIKDIPTDDRPRERLLLCGEKNLSNEELLAILLNTGYKETSVRNLALKVLADSNGIEGLKNLTYENLIKIKGIGHVKACTILAFNELARRVNLNKVKISGQKFTSPDIVFEYFKNKMDWNKEQVYCLYLDSSHKIIKDKLLFVGTVNKSMIHPRDIFKEAYMVNASAIICIHNHPSDNTDPSLDDMHITDNLKQVSNLMGIDFLDHIIIGKTNYYSFMENGKI